MALYAANNIAKCVARFSSRNEGKLGGIIGNARLGVDWEEDLIRGFARRIGSEVVAFIPRDRVFHNAETRFQTLLEFAPEHSISTIFTGLAERVADAAPLVRPEPLDMAGLEQLVKSYE